VRQQDCLSAAPGASEYRERVTAGALGSGVRRDATTCPKTYALRHENASRRRIMASIPAAQAAKSQRGLGVQCRTVTCSCYLRPRGTCRGGHQFGGQRASSVRAAVMNLFDGLSIWEVESDQLLGRGRERLSKPTHPDRPYQVSRPTGVYRKPKIHGPAGRGHDSEHQLLIDSVEKQDPSPGQDSTFSAPPAPTCFGRRLTAALAQPSRRRRPGFLRRCAGHAGRH
jgi:hypothetical protein